MCCQKPPHLLTDIETLLDTFTAAEISRRSGLYYGTIRVILDGTVWVGPKTFQQLAGAFGLTIGELVDVLAPRYFAAGKTDAYWFVLNWRHRIMWWQRKNRGETQDESDAQRPKTKEWRVKLRAKAAAAASGMKIDRRPMPPPMKGEEEEGEGEEREL